MTAKSSLQQTLSQQQVLTPQMRQGLEVLQANTMELAQIVRTALEENPVLEEMPQLESLENIDSRQETDDSLNYLNETDDDWRERDILSSGSGAEQQAYRDFLYQSIVAPTTLQEHLAQQLRTSLLELPLRLAAEALLGNLDERGFFDLSPEEFAEHNKLPLDDLKQASDFIRSLDPAGVGAIDLRDCLLLQLERKGLTDSIEFRIVENHLSDLATKHFEKIARSLGTSEERVAEAAETIGRLNPNPGGDYDPTSNPIITPDVIIERNPDAPDTWWARLTGDYLPRLQINDFYKDLLGKTAEDPQARKFLRQHLQQARDLIGAVSLRQETILHIAELLIQYQSEFLEKGPSALKPLTMNQFAEELNVHPTTITRAVAGKFVLTPYGITPLRSFFTSGYRTSSGESIANSAVRDTLQAIIANENPGKPFSDEELVEQLKKQGIDVARRTVAKYRNQLKILPARLRRK